MNSNFKLAEIFNEIADYLDMEGVAFKPRAYEKVAEAIVGMEEDVEALYKRGGLKALCEIPGVGASIAEKIEEFIKTGKIKYHAELKKETPVELGELRRIEGLGPKKIKHLYENLGIKNVADLKKALQAGKIRALEGFGEKSEENLLRGLQFLESSGNRYVWSDAQSTVESIKTRFEKLKGVDRVAVAGSFRRHKETIGDADILVGASDSKAVMDYFVKMPEVINVIGHGETKSSVKWRGGMNVDVRVVESKSYGAALNYFTGSKDHNVRLRQIAIDKGLKLNEYGLWKGEKMIAGATEEEIYETLGLRYIEPEMREGAGEIELAQKNKLPKIIEYGAIMGDLQVQTNWSDGAASISDMVSAAIKIGLKYIAITDHTHSLKVTGGLDEKRILDQIKEIDGLNKEFRSKKKDFRILKGSECDILKDGSLDLPDYILEKLDVVGASIHSYFKLDEEEQTRRLIKAMRNPNVDIIFHPTARLLNKREPLALDMDRIIQTAKETGTILEINAYPERSDLSDSYVRKCVELGVKMCIDSDAHHPSHFGHLDNGVGIARRGWATKKDIINAHPVEKMLSFLKQ